MYPNLYFFLKEVFGIELNGFKLINTFGFMVALAFLSAAWALTSELKRREQAGWLRYTEQEIWVGKGASWNDVGWNILFGFIAGWKFVGFFIMKEEAYADPQTFLLSGMGSIPAGIMGAIIMGAWRWYEGNKTKMPTPEKRTIRIWPHDRVGDIIILGALFGFGGAKVFHNLENWEELVKDPLNALLSFSGLTFYGGLICAGAAILWYGHKHKINLWQMVDSFGPALMLAYAVGRIGCQVAGDGDWGIVNSAYVASPEGKAVLATSAEYKTNVANYLDFYRRAQHGVKEVNVPEDVLHASFKAPAFLPTWMVAYTYPHNVLSEGIPIADCDERQWCNRLPMPVFPAPFYETLMGLAIFGILWGIRKQLRTSGMLFGIYLIFNGIERFLIEKIRVNTTYSFWGIHPTQAEIISVCLVITGVLIVVIRRQKGKVQAVNTSK